MSLAELHRVYVEYYLRENYGLEPNDIDLDAKFYEEALEVDETPEQVGEWFAEKYDLDRIN